MEDDSQYWDFCDSLKNNEDCEILYSKIPPGVKRIIVEEELTGRKTKCCVEFYYVDKITTQFHFNIVCVNFRKYGFYIMKDNCGRTTYELNVESIN